MDWLLNITQPLTPNDLDEMDRELAVAGTVARASQERPTLAVSLHDIAILDNNKWFGEADIRIDALVITGQGKTGDPHSFYMPKTTSFSRVRDGDFIPLGSGGLLAYYGPVLHFLDIFVMVSRDRKDMDSLASLLHDNLQSDELNGGIEGMLGLAVATPQVAAIMTAIKSATIIGDFAYQILRKVSGTTIGLFRSSHLQYRDGFGIGPHPGPGKECFLVKDLSFRYVISSEDDRLSS